MCEHMPRVDLARVCKAHMTLAEYSNDVLRARVDGYLKYLLAELFK